MSIIRAFNKAYQDMERKKWDKFYVFFDLHSTIIKPNYKAGNIPTEFYPYAREVLQMLTKLDDICMSIYTCSFPHEVDQYQTYFKENDIEFEFVNENPEVKTIVGGYGYYEDKPYMNVLFEDKCGFNAETEWEDVYYYLKDRYSEVNSRNLILFNEKKKQHTDGGGVMPMETALTHLVYNAISRGNYKKYRGGGYDVEGNHIKKYDVVCYFSLSNDPYFMVALDVSEGDMCDLYMCNDDVKIIKKVV
jgi:hypothetical protein